MPLNILLPIVVIGIGGITLLILLLRPTPSLGFPTPDAAVQTWNRRNPLHPARRAIPNPAGTHALIMTDTVPGLLWSMGADPVTRLLDMPLRVKETGKGLVVQTADFTAPRIAIPLPDGKARRQWRALLEEHA